MSRLLDLQQLLLETSAAMAKAERFAVEGSDPESLSINIASLGKRYAELERDFASAAADQGCDVCSYRLIPEGARPTVMGLTKALGTFQSLFSIVYQALKEGPRRRARLDAQVLEETSFGLGYVFPGSIGVVLTLPNERLLLGETPLDTSIRTIAEIGQLTSSEQIAHYAHQLGPASIRAAFAWARDHAESSFSADVEWLRGEQVRTGIRMNVPRFRELQQIIGETSEQVVEEILVAGLLVGADVPRHAFHLVTDTGEIRGTFIDTISEAHTVELPKRYSARIKKTTSIVYAVEEEKVSYLLLSLEPLT
jgi:hypothetical protein